jgi:hypothetical protein
MYKVIKSPFYNLEKELNKWTDWNVVQMLHEKDGYVIILREPAKIVLEK